MQVKCKGDGAGEETRQLIQIEMRQVGEAVGLAGTLQASWFGSFAVSLLWTVFDHSHPQ